MTNYCDIISFVGKIIMVIILILLGLFGVYVLNANQGEKPATISSKDPLLNLSSVSPTQTPLPTQAQTLNITAPKTSSQSSQSQTVTQNEAATATIQTGKGNIEISFYSKDAPNTVANFVKLAKQGFYNGVIFHRVIKGFMIQGGDPTGTGGGGPGYQFADELNPSTPSYQEGYKKGVVAMANSGPNTNGSQFFIMLADYPLPNNYTIFGKVIKGQEIVDEIGSEPTGANDRPITPIAINSVTVTE
jgi:cyclophilin family peptidyl-prolyl cis-trans isomerase